MQLLRKIASFGPNIKDLILIYTSFCRIILEGSCEVWGSSLSEKNINDIERCQKAAVKIMVPKNSYKNYHQGLKFLNLETLKKRRKQLMLNFAKKARFHDKMNHLFPKNDTHYSTRNKETYKVFHANTKRYQQSSIIYMQQLLNEYKDKRIK